MDKLKDILYKTGIRKIIGGTSLTIKGVSIDSRTVGEGQLFVAIRGTVTDGHRFIRQAEEKGAVAIVCEKIPEEIRPGTTYVEVEDSKKALGAIASNYYDDPSSSLKLIGVTGTNGKTTVVTLLYRLFMKLGYGTSMLSTIENRINDHVFPASHTTPDALSIHRFLREAADAGCTYCFMEVSSHAAHQERIAGLRFAGGIFTNLTHDHLDYHADFKDYLASKKKFFDMLPKESFALTNADDRNSGIMTQNTRAEVHTYALRSPAGFRSKILENQLGGLHMILDGIDFHCRMIGAFNAYNLLAVYGTALLLRQDREQVLTILSEMPAAEGRFQYITNKENVTGIVDYAHTPDALKNVLETIESIRTRNEKVITVVGAGGDRDRSKRPMMAGISARKSDKIILTSDNPRSEDPNEIILEMMAGVETDRKRDVLVISDRREAIKAACSLARTGDIILVAGKGHEKYQEIKGVRYPFDDMEVLKEHLIKP